jgi:DNA replication protein DnaC
MKKESREPQDQSVREEILRRLDALRLKRIAEILDEHLAKAQKTKPSYSHFFLGLLDEELVAQVDRATERRIRTSGLPDRPTLEGFDFAYQQKLDKRAVMELGELGFLETGHHVIFTGDPGTGKSHLGKAILHNALMRGKRGLFVDAQELVDELFESQADRSTRRVLKRYVTADVLMIDEAGFLTLEPSQPNQLFRLISMRSERGLPVIITSNLLPEQLVAKLAPPEMAPALKDRLVNGSHHIHIDGPSWRGAEAERRRQRTRQAKERQKEQPAEARAFPDGASLIT